MNAEQTISEIEWLERIFAVPDARPLSPTDLSTANRRHDEKQAHSPWQSERAKPKSKSRVNRPGGRPNTFSRIRSRAVAPARKYEKPKEFAVCATALSGSRTSGLSGLRSWKIGRDVLFID
jgi:hypothetical protein